MEDKVVDGYEMFHDHMNRDANILYGIVTEIFDDLNPKDPWIRVAFTHPAHTYQWCKESGLVVVQEGGHKDPPRDGVRTGSL